MTSDSPQSESWERVAKVVYVDNADQANQFYETWAQRYESDMSNLDWQSPQGLVEEVLLHIDHSEMNTLLDVGAGTGLCGEILRRMGYKGTMDAIEYSAAMLREAEKKSIYRNHVVFGLFPGKDLPVQDNSYDCVICSGCLGKNHIEADCIESMIKALKPGGIIAFNSRGTEHNKDFLRKLESNMEAAVMSGIIREVNIKDTIHYASKCRETGNVMTCKLYVYRKALK